MCRDGVFLTWNDSRRSKSLAARLDLKRITFVAKRYGMRRHLVGAAGTAMFLIRHRPAVIWYQFSWLLGLVLALYTRLRGEDRTVLVADIHTKALRRAGPNGLRPLINWLKGWSLPVARVTLVTNNENAA